MCLLIIELLKLSFKFNQSKTVTISVEADYWQTLPSAALQKSHPLNHLAVFDWLHLQLNLISSKIVPQYKKKIFTGQYMPTRSMLSSLEPAPGTLLMIHHCNVPFNYWTAKTQFEIQSIKNCDYLSRGWLLTDSAKCNSAEKSPFESFCSFWLIAFTIEFDQFKNCATLTKLRRKYLQANTCPPGPCCPV